MKKNDLLKSMELISQFNNREACRQIHDILSDILRKCRREDIESKENKSLSVERDAFYIRGTVQGPSHKDEFKKAGEITCETVTLTLSDADLTISSAYPSDKLDETVILETKNIVDVGFEQHNDEEKIKESEKINVPLDIKVGDLEDTVIIGKTKGDKKDSNVSEIMKAELCEDEAGKFHWKEKDLEKTHIITPIKNRLEKKVFLGQEAGTQGGHVVPEASGQINNDQLREDGDANFSWDGNDLEKTVIISSRDAQNTQAILDDEKKVRIKTL